MDPGRNKYTGASSIRFSEGPKQKCRNVTPSLANGPICVVLGGVVRLEVGGGRHIQTHIQTPHNMFKHIFKHPATYSNETISYGKTNVLVYSTAALNIQSIVRPATKYSINRKNGH